MGKPKKNLGALSSTTAAMSANRLPPVPKLRVRRPYKTEPNPCLAVMNSVLACWASSGPDSTACITFEASLRECMDKPKPPKQPRNPINYHLTRLYSRLVGPHKKKR